MEKLNGKVAVVTGAANGIGRATAELFAGHGATVCVTDVLVEDGEELTATIGDAAVFMEHDVTSEKDWQRVVLAVKERFGRLDILVNNAGISPMGTIEDTTFDQWKNVMNVNADSIFLGCKYGVETMKDAGNGGSIVNLSSGRGLRAGGDLTAYCASKAAVAMLTKCVALHCGTEQYGIRCNSVHPGGIRTRMLEDYIAKLPDPEAALAGLASQSVVGRVGEVADIANMILYLASDESSFVTGSEMVVDGGMIL